jgi:glycogen synthase
MSGAKELRVLQVSARFLPQVGGVERHMYEVATRLPDHGVAVEVLTTDAVGDLEPRETLSGIPIERVPAYPRHWDLYVAPGIYRRIRRGGWDIVHVQGIHTFVPPFAMLAARRTRIPYVVTFHTGGHSSRVRSRLRRWQWTALRPPLRDAAQLIAVSHFERRLFQRDLGLSASRFEVIPNGARIDVDRSEFELGPVDPNLILSVGRVERYKGHWRLLEALPALLQQRPAARLRIVGDGPDREPLMRRAHELGIAEKVEIGPIPTADRRQLIELLSRAGVFALLSEYEAHGIAVMEALDLGRPVVVADTSGLSEIAESGWARAIPLDAPPRLVATALLEALDSPGIAEAKLPTWDEATERLAEIYRRVVLEASR